MTLTASRGRQMTHCSVKGTFHQMMKTDADEAV